MDKVRNSFLPNAISQNETEKNNIHVNETLWYNLSNVLLRKLNTENVYNFMLYGKKNWYYKAMADVWPKKNIFYAKL